MSETVFILGAGFNQHIKDWDGLSPPLANNFFSLLQHSSQYSSYYQEKLTGIYSFIREYWKLTEDDLKKRDFNLEELYTVIQLKIQEAYKSQRHDVQNDLMKLN